MRHLLFPAFKQSRLGFSRNVGGFVYRLRDDFAADAIAPLSSPRDCDPGPGVLSLVQNDGQFSISDDALNFPVQAGPSYEKQGWIGTVQTRVKGLCLITRITLTTQVNISPVVWKVSNASVNPSTAFGDRYGLAITNTAGARLYTGNTASFQISDNVLAATTYELALVCRDPGMYYFIKGGDFTRRSLLWVTHEGNEANLYPSFANLTSAGRCEFFRVVDLVASGYPLWNDNYYLATQRLAGVVSNGQTFIHTSDGHVEWICTARPTGSPAQSVHFRKVDASNYWEVTISSTGALVLNEIVAGVSNPRQTAAGVVSSGDRIVVIFNGTTIRGYSNKVLQWTHTGATNFQAAVNGVMNNTGSGGAISDLITWPYYYD